VHREHKHIVARAQDLAIAIPLMHIKVYDGCAPYATLFHQPKDRHSTIVKDAKPFSGIAHRMMRAPCKIPRKPIF
jgi:hypothetical protein